MSKADDNLDCTTIPSPNYQISGYTTVLMEQWYCYVDRGRLIFVQGSQNCEKKNLEALKDKCLGADSDPDFKDCPKHFTIEAKPLDLVRFARRILAFYKGYDDVL